MAQNAVFPKTNNFVSINLCHKKKQQQQHSKSIAKIKSAKSGTSTLLVFVISDSIHGFSCNLSNIAHMRQISVAMF